MKKRIALFADVHANLPALKAVIADARSRSVDECWNLGDMIGYAPFPNECIDLLRQACLRHVLGNHDIKCADGTHAAKMRAAGKDPDKVFSFEWTHQALSPESLAFIARIPRTEPVLVEGVRVLMTHGSPQGMSDCLTPRTPVAKLLDIASLLTKDGVRLVLCGHTHEFFDRVAGGVRFINPGGVGRSFDNDLRASYAIVSFGLSGKMDVEHIRVPYSLDELTVAMRDRGFPDRLTRSFEEARSLEEIVGLKSDATEQCLQAAMALCHKTPHEAHSLQVMRLAGQLFDELKSLHKLGWRESVYLRVAAVLHDIGFVYGKEGHHKTSRDLILKDRSLPLDARERVLVALIARYHRGSLPDVEHRYYDQLTSYEQETVGALTACLRIADGLDRTHRSLVTQVKVSLGEKRLTFTVTPRRGRDISEEIAVARVKADLLERIFGLTVAFKVAT
ncbi:MAG: metallophosphoesterase family protein [Candidatus Omnitrophota bacterium]